MPKAIMIVFSDPSDPAREEEFGRWYDGTHIPDVLKVPGIKTATRYKLSTTQMVEAKLPGSCLTLYELDSDDLDDIPAGLGKAAGNGELPMSDVITVGPMFFFEQQSETITE